jgi:branched-chain amino acid transport system permease protein
LETSTLIQQMILNGVMSGSIYVLVALGLSLILAVTGIVQIAHGEMYMLGGYITYSLCVQQGLPFVASLAIATLVVGVLGVPIEKIFYRPFRHGEFEPMVIMGLALMLILQTSAILIWDPTFKFVRTPFPGVYHVGSAIITQERLIIIVVGTIFIVGFFLFLQKTRQGRAMRAVAQDMTAASLQGINIDNVSSLAMFLGCCLAGVAGGLMGAIFSLSPTMGSPVFMTGISVIILGGLGSIVGAVAGGYILGFVNSITSLLFSLYIADAASFFIIILILLFKPQGLMGHPSQ